MKKHRIAAALAAACMTMSLVLTAQAASPVSEAEAAQVIRTLGIMVGDSRGEMHLSDPVTRAEFITMAIKASRNGSRVGQASVAPYPDVSRSHWASGYVEAGVAAGLISGYADGTFRPENRISLAEGVTIVLALLDYGAADFSGVYPTGQMAQYHRLKLDQGMTAVEASDLLTRRDAMYLFYNLMTASSKEGRPYLAQLGFSLNTAGELDMVDFMNQSMEGPVVARGSWEENIPFDVQSAVVWVAGKTATPADIREGDVVYWNRWLNTLWVYRDQVIGAIQALEPSSSAPTSVTVAGRKCAIETAAASYVLSDLGGYRLGDRVILLLGRDGGVAAVEADTSASREGPVGVITGMVDATYSDGRGGLYTARTALLLATDGRTYQYQAPTHLKEGDLVRVSVSVDGETTLKKLESSAISGKVNMSGTMIGRLPFAQDAEILDVSGNLGVRVFPNRLAGITLSESVVRYCAQNSAGEIDRLILKDVTGDTYSYGILTDVTEMPGGILSSCYTYALDIGGEAIVIPQTTTRYPAERGPIRLVGTAQKVNGLYSLCSAGTGTVSRGRFTVGDTVYAIADNVVIYEYRDKTYYLSSMGRIEQGNYALTGWYDQAESDGGRIRILVAREK